MRTRGDRLATRNVSVHAVLMIAALIPVCAAQAQEQVQVRTTLDDFFHPGTQPDQSGGADFASILISDECRLCHEDIDVFVPIYTRWSASMMANSARDPLFQASLAIANQDAAFAGDLCLRCHTPGGWLGNRSVPTDGSSLRAEDFDGVTCTVCHRMVDPVFQAGVSPTEDESIIDALKAGGLWTPQPGNGGYVVDPVHVRRGPFDDVPLNAHFPVEIIHSPFHTTSDHCGTCHDVSNPAFTRQPDDTYVLNELGMSHLTSDKYDMFPMERTYSEWLNSQYANGGVDASGVFGGNHATGIMVSCQDCHMPDFDGFGSVFHDDDPFFQRPNVPAHNFTGGNTWMPGVILDLFPGAFPSQYLDPVVERARFMLQNAATLEVVQDQCSVSVRIYNNAGHKLPTGNPDGRRMWLNMEFRDDKMNPVVERGAYGELTADLTTADTKVYEAIFGHDATMAAETGLPEGPSFHAAVSNKIYKDNRIPPRGFNNAAFAAAQAAPVAATYADGQYWDDTMFLIPPGATSAVVSLYYQTASKEYVTFLRDENKTNEAGDVMYDLWEMMGMSPPELMARVMMPGLVAGLAGDADCDADVDLDDLALSVTCITGPGQTLTLGCESLDADFDSDTDLADLAAFQRSFSGSP